MNGILSFFGIVGSFVASLFGLHGQVATSTPAAPSSTAQPPAVVAGLPRATTTTYVGVGGYPNGIAFDGKNIWVVNEVASFDGTPGSVTKISPSGATTTYKGTGSTPAAIAFDGTNMWTANLNSNSVTKITPTGQMTNYKGTGDAPSGIVFSGGDAWTVNFKGDSVTKITPTGQMTTYKIAGGLVPVAIASDGTNVWVADQPGIADLNLTPHGAVTRITPAGVMTTYPISGAKPYAIASDGTNMWTADINPDTVTVTKVTPSGVARNYSGPGVETQSIASDGTNMWVVDGDGNSVTKITPAGVMTTYSGIDADGGIVFDGTNMWVADFNKNSVTKIDIAALSSAPAGGSSSGGTQSLNVPLLEQARDSQRVSDFATLKSSISLYLADMNHPVFACTDAKTIYASAPITPPPGWKAGANMGSRAVNGTGWIPIDFGAITSGAPFGTLPVDPVNDPSRRLVYLFACDPSTFKYEIEAVMESPKYGYGGSMDIVSTDGGIDPHAYEQGNFTTPLIPANFLGQ